MSRRTEFFRGRHGRRVEVYIELRDLWVGVFVSPTAVYVCCLGLVLRVRRAGADLGGGQQ